VSENGIDVSDPGSSNGPSLGAGVSSTTLSFVSISIVLLHFIMRVEHFERLVLYQRASRPEQVEKCVTWHRAMVAYRIGKVGRHAREALLNVVPSHEQVE